jgi:hypothetical protein
LDTSSGAAVTEATSQHELLFSYGTLQLESVQIATFGRTLSGTADELPGFELSTVEIDDRDVVKKSGKARHSIARFTNRDGDTVKGAVFRITATELGHSDKYEVAAYARVAVKLSSGAQAWAYVDARHLPGTP